MNPCGSGRTTESVLYFRHNRRRCSLLSLSLSLCVCVCAGGGVLPPSLATERATASVCAGGRRAEPQRYGGNWLRIEISKEIDQRSIRPLQIAEDAGEDVSSPSSRPLRLPRSLHFNLASHLTRCQVHFFRRARKQWRACEANDRAQVVVERIH